MGDEEQRGPRRGQGAVQPVEQGAGDGRVERGGRLVGHEQAGPAGQRGGEGDPLTLPAGELRRAGARQLGGQVDLGEELGDPARALARSSPWWRRSGIASWRPTDSSGCRATAESWATSATSRPRTSARAVSDAPTSSVSATRTLPVAVAPGGRRPATAAAVRDFPAPDGPTSAPPLAVPDPEGEPVDPGGPADEHPEITDLGDRGGRRRPRPYASSGEVRAVRYNAVTQKHISIRCQQAAAERSGST